MKHFLAVGLSFFFLSLGCSMGREPATYPYPYPDQSLVRVLEDHDSKAVVPANSQEIEKRRSSSSGNREGDSALQFSTGFTKSPDTFLLGFEADNYLWDRFSLGPLVQFGVSDDEILLAPTFNFKASFDISDESLKRVRPYVQGGVGFLYLHEDNRPGRDDELGFLMNAGIGADLRINDKVSVGTSLLLNIMPNDVLGERSFFTWQFITLTFHL